MRPIVTHGLQVYMHVPPCPADLSGSGEALPERNVPLVPDEARELARELLRAADALDRHRELRTTDGELVPFDPCLGCISVAGNWSNREPHTCEKGARTSRQKLGSGES